ncbi:MAG: hypothetical protein JO362_07760 [Streptomycetaceae bacterium]|nr:hypothetical protein [Streptomycetaceae bacterium]
MSDAHLSECRLLVRQAADELAEDARALTAASAEALEVGLTARVADLRRAVVAAWRAGVPVEDLARDAHLKIDMIEDWVAAENPHHNP